MKEKSLNERLQEGIAVGIVSEKAIVKLIGALFEEKEEITAINIISAINGYTDGKYDYYDDWYADKPEEVAFDYNTGIKVAVIEKLSKQIKKGLKK